MISDTSTEFLEHAVNRLARMPEFMAASIRVWTKAFKRPPEEALGVNRRSVLELGLCRRPRADRWLSDVEIIAKEVGIDTERLVSFIRAADAIERFADAPMAEGLEDGRLLAARDWEEGDLE